MWPDYTDIKSRLGEPLWYDEHGVPRYEPFKPEMCDVYAEYAALMLVECQECGRQFMVAKTLNVLDIREFQQARREFLPTAASIGAFHYGDPPRHESDESGDDCVAGVTMNVITRKILEFWHLDKEQFAWKRLPEREVDVDEFEEAF